MGIKQNMVDILKTKRVKNILISSTPTNVTILHILVPSFT